VTLTAASPAAASLHAQSGAPSYDLLITGGRVVDPSQGLSAVRDVGIAQGKILRVDADIPRRQAKQVIDASGKFVTPGWIDMHVHVFDGVGIASIDADSAGVRRGVTTVVDGGSAGATTFPGFRRHIIERAQTSVYALLNISAIGFVVTTESYIDPKLIDPDAATRIITANRDRILGIKVRIDGRDETAERDVEILRRGRVAADASGVPILMHWARDPRLISMLKAGDVMTHPFNPPRAGPDLFGPDGRIMEQFLDLPKRGIFTDFSHGGHLLWATAEKAAKSSWYPDIISTDLHRAHIAPNGNVVDLATTMAKFMYLGLSFEQVVERVTARPVKALKFGGAEIGTLAPGAVADVTICDVVERPIQLLDSTKEPRTGRRAIDVVTTIKAGTVVAKTATN
jgi:dihydroorotase